MFSRKTIVEAFELLERKTHDEISKFTFKYGLDKKDMGSSKSQRVFSIIRYLTNPSEDRDQKEKEIILYEIIKELVDEELSGSDSKIFEENNKKLYRELKKDGFIIDGEELRYEYGENLDISKKQSTIEVLLTKYNFRTAKFHFEAALDNHKEGKWSSANSQLRDFVEELFNKMPEKIFNGESLKPKGYPRRESLSTTVPPILNKDLNEWDSNGKGFINGFYKRLHPEGSHPGLSSIEDCTFRIQLVILTMSEVLRRFDNYMNLKSKDF